MPLPKKALRVGELQSVGGSAITQSANKVEQFYFIDAEGKRVDGFFKPVHENYPVLLAKYNVAASICARIIKGDLAAEDRLVFDPKGSIVGTFSTGIPDYQHLLRSGKAIPDDPKQRKRVAPTETDLLEFDVSENLALTAYSECPDRHPNNFDVKNFIDFDMLWYSITYILKGNAHWNDKLKKETPDKFIPFKTSDLDNFPILTNRTHYPTNETPGNLNIKKKYNENVSEAFRNLAKNPSITTEKGTVCFQDQMFRSFLKILLVHEPEMLKARLEDYFGDIPLDYLAEEESKGIQLSQAHPKLFNSKTNRETFVEHWMALSKQKYDNLFQSVVFYQGCKENSYGVPVPAFSQFLENKPSFLEEILDWTKAQNELMQASAEHPSNKKCELEEDHPPLDKHCMPEKARYDLKKIRQRYHEIWRDSHICYFQQILEDTKELMTQLHNALSIKPMEPLAEQKPDPTNPKFTRSWEILEETPKVNKKMLLAVNCDKKNTLNEVLALLFEFNERLRKSCMAYYQLENNDLPEIDNEVFCSEIQNLVTNYICQIHDTFGNSITPWIQDFRKIIADLQRLYCSLNLTIHLNSKDRPINAKNPYDYPALISRAHTDKEVISVCMKTLFNWASTIDRSILIAYIEDIIVSRYQPTWYDVIGKQWRQRTAEVQPYLKASHEDGANLLAHILSTGDHESTSLNTWLVHDLIQYMCKDTIGKVEVNLLSVREAFNRNKFDGEEYAKKASSYAKNDERFTHIYSKNAIQIFNQAMYEWIKDLPQEQFKDILKTAINKYSPYSFSLWRAPRNVKEILNPSNISPQDYKLAKIFSEGGLNDNSLNTKLFKIILKNMKEEFATNKEMENHPAAAIVQQINETNQNRFLESLQPFAKLLCKEIEFQSELKLRDQKSVGMAM